MQRFVQLHTELENQPSAQARQAALRQYLAQAPADDQAWARFLLAGGKLRPQVSPRLMRQAACAAAGLPAWLLEQSYQAVGDLAETIAHLLPPPTHPTPLSLADWIQDRLLALGPEAPSAKVQALLAWWPELDSSQRFVVNKLLSGHWRSPLNPDDPAPVLGISEHLPASPPAAWADHAGLTAPAGSRSNWQRPAPALQATAVLLYAHPSAGSSAHPHGAYTLGVWSRTPKDLAEIQRVLTQMASRQPADPQGLQLLPLARVANNLPSLQKQAVEHYIQNHLLEKFGPVRSVLPQLVFEFAFDALAPSKRHKSGLMLQSPRLLRLLSDTHVSEVDTLGKFRAWLDPVSAP